MVFTKDDQIVCVVRKKHPSLFLLYKLERMAEYSAHFYGNKHKFEIGLKQDLSLAKQPYGFLGSSIDLSGRRMSVAAQKGKPLVSYSGEKTLFLECPIYSLIGEYGKSELMKALDEYSAEQRDIPYASLSVSSIGMGDAGEDFYINTLFFITTGYGLLAKTSIIAGRDIEDCCSPEIYNELYKVRLNRVNPLKRIQEKDMIAGAVLANWTVSTSPEVTTPVEIRFNDSAERIRAFDRLLNELYINLLAGEIATDFPKTN